MALVATLRMLGCYTKWYRKKISKYPNQKGSDLPVIGPRNHTLQVSSFPKHLLQSVLLCSSQRLASPEILSLRKGYCPRVYQDKSELTVDSVQLLNCHDFQQHTELKSSGWKGPSRRPAQIRAENWQRACEKHWNQRQVDQEMHSRAKQG